MKTCNKCGSLKPTHEFTLESARKDGRASTCSTCVNSRARFLYKQDPRGQLIASAKYRAKLANVPFALTKEDLVVPNVCPALEIPIFCGEYRSKLDNSPSLDRLIPSKGYVRGNVIVISSLANRIKNSATSEQLFAVANWLKNHEQP